MEEKQQKTVYGYLRNNYDGIYPDDIIKLIYMFYLLSIDSKIINDEEQSSLLNLLYNTLKEKDNYKNMKSMNVELLYRGSENSYLASKFHELCNNKGATITIAHNEKDYVFGGFTSKSWTDGHSTKSIDPNAFLFVIRPNVKAFGFAGGNKDGDDAICHYTDYGPVFGAGADLWIHNRCTQGNNNGANPTTYAFKTNEMLGSEYDDGSHYFKITDYEVFSVVLE